MAEYIERETVLEKIEQKQDELNSLELEYNDMARGEWNGLQTAVDSVLCVPAADVAPVVHGRWDNGKCTVCSFDLRGLTDGENDLEQWVWDEGFPHCPNCGARMDGDEK